MVGWKSRFFAIALIIGAIIGVCSTHAAWAQDKKPNILVIMGDEGLDTARLHRESRAALDAIRTLIAENSPDGPA